MISSDESADAQYCQERPEPKSGRSGRAKTQCEQDRKQRSAHGRIVSQIRRDQEKENNNRDKHQRRPKHPLK
jgi:hypothetical protein